MSKVQMLRASVTQRLTAAAEEIFVLFERSIAEYEEELSRSKEENERQRKLLDAVFNPQLQLHRADIQQLSESKEKVPPEQQEWSSSLDQEDPEPPHIKEEQEELLTSQEGEQLQGLIGVDIPSSPVSVKSPRKTENREAEPTASSSTEQMVTEADGEDCEGSEPARNSDPVKMMKTNLSPHSFIQVKLRRTERQSLQPAAQLNRWKQTLMERIVEDQNQPGTHIQIDFYNLILMTGLYIFLNLILVLKSGTMIGRYTGRQSRRTQVPHTLKRNRRNSGPVGRESSLKDLLQPAD
eukprot:superscaffoldBa00008981_g23769